MYRVFAGIGVARAVIAIGRAVRAVLHRRARWCRHADAVSRTIIRAAVSFRGNAHIRRGDLKVASNYRHRVVAILRISRCQNIFVGADCVHRRIRTAVRDRAKVARIHKAFHTTREGRVVFAVGLGSVIDSDRCSLRRDLQPAVRHYKRHIEIRIGAGEIVL